MAFSGTLSVALKRKCNFVFSVSLIPATSSHTKKVQALHFLSVGIKDGMLTHLELCFSCILQQAHGPKSGSSSQLTHIISTEGKATFEKMKD